MTLSMSLPAIPKHTPDTPAVPAVPVLPVDLIAEAASNFPHRPSWDEYFMEVTRAIAKRGTCDRVRLGCVIAKDRQILATGYN